MHPCMSIMHCRHKSQECSVTIAAHNCMFCGYGHGAMYVSMYEDISLWLCVYRICCNSLILTTINLDRMGVSIIGSYIGLLLQLGLITNGNARQTNTVL